VTLCKLRASSEIADILTEYSVWHTMLELLLAYLSLRARVCSSSGLDKGTILQDISAFTCHHQHNSVSTQVSVLRRLLLYPDHDERGRWFGKVTAGKISLVVHVHLADVIMATLLSLKKDAEEKTGAKMRLTFFGGAEAHLLAQALASANVRVVLLPSRSFTVTQM
jgi:hypothetical protein